MRVPERSVIRVLLAVVAVSAVASGARAAHADLTEAALVLLVTVLAVGTLGFPSGLAAAVVGFFATLIPTIVQQVTEIVEQAPTWVRDFMNSDLFRTLDDQFGIPR